MNVILTFLWQTLQFLSKDCSQDFIGTLALTSNNLENLLLSSVENGNIDSLHGRQYQCSSLVDSSRNCFLQSLLHFKWKNFSQRSQQILFSWDLNLILHLWQLEFTLQIEQVHCSEVSLQNKSKSCWESLTHEKWNHESQSSQAMQSLIWEKSWLHISHFSLMTLIRWKPLRNWQGENFSC